LGKELCLRKMDYKRIRKKFEMYGRVEGSVLSLVTGTHVIDGEGHFPYEGIAGLISHIDYDKEDASEFCEELQEKGMNEFEILHGGKFISAMVNNVAKEGDSIALRFSTATPAYIGLHSRDIEYCLQIEKTHVFLLDAGSYIGMLSENCRFHINGDVNRFIGMNSKDCYFAIHGSADKGLAAQAENGIFHVGHFEHTHRIGKGTRVFTHGKLAHPTAKSRWRNMTVL